ncbi:MAG: alpha/beta fold hydrolase [Pseudomonadota bacterium]
MASLWKWWAGALVLLLVVWFGAGWYLSGQFLTLGIADYTPAQEQELLRSLGLEGEPREDVIIHSGEVALAGSWFAHPSPGDCAVILLPGIGGHRTQVLPALPLFSALGCHVLAYDPRGTGASSRVLRTFGYREAQDNLAAVQWIQTQTGLGRERIGVWGPSFGAAVGLLTLREADDLAFIIADSTFSSLRQVTFDTIALLSDETFATLFNDLILFFLELRTGMVVDDVDPTEVVRATNTPILLIHAVEDPAMDVSHSRRVHGVIEGQNGRLVETDWGAGHADSALVDPEAYRAIVHTFLAELGFARPAA